MKRLVTGRPLVFAHRGASRAAPENTLPAFQAAMDQGADGVELDVRYSSDGHLVVMHNPDLAGSTNGQGRVSAQTLEHLRSLDAGSKHSPQFAGTRIPTLDEALDLMAGRCLVNIEIKSPDVRTGDVARDVIAAVHKHKMVDQVVVSSFNPFALRSIKALAPDIEAAYLIAQDLPAWLRWPATHAFSRAEGVNPDFKMVDATYMAGARRRGRPVSVWTVDEEADMRRMIDLGVDSIITDVPDRLLALLAGANRT